MTISWFEWSHSDYGSFGRKSSPSADQIEHLLLKPEIGFLEEYHVLCFRLEVESFRGGTSDVDLKSRMSS